MSSARTIYKMKIKKIIDHTKSVRELIIETSEPNEFNFRAGQFVMLHVPQSESKPALRAYSIASEEQNKHGFKLLFKYVDQGKASEFVWSLKGDETLQFTGPFGKVFFQEPPNEQIIFLNTGTGVSQHLSYLLSMGHKYPDLKYRMLFGVRHETDIYYQDVLEYLTQKIKNFKYEFVLSRPEGDWQGKKGYVQNFLNEFDFKNTPTTFYMCGNGGMIKEVKLMLSEAGFDSKNIWSEAFD